MRRNQVISKRKLISNIVGWPDYYISKRSRLYRYYPKRKVWMLLKGTLNRGRIYHILRVRELIRDKAKGYSNKELGEKYKLSKASISHYLNRSL